MSTAKISIVVKFIYRRLAYWRVDIKSIYAFPFLREQASRLPIKKHRVFGKRGA
ncbi:hypothetical protein PCARR_a0276 [Pseudoalteromonas carrageenovora IAM 12662]|uniref:Uncharacterized protein n=1 Tax=Pseudoalteromonas carrageenovora IAM 12662 TaxID=1314868 RepID=A0ABR9EN94_PSEVC|nr:hypothetical protein [Pseudoalteromonas carrageenovora IAM 12662]